MGGKELPSLEEAIACLPLKARLDKKEKEQMDKLEKENDKRIKAGKPPKKPKEKKKEYPPDGYTRPLYVRKGEWVMRLRKRVGYMSTFFLIPS